MRETQFLTGGAHGVLLVLRGHVGLGRHFGAALRGRLFPGQLLLVLASPLPSFHLFPHLQQICNVLTEADAIVVCLKEPAVCVPLGTVAPATSCE